MKARASSAVSVRAARAMLDRGYAKLTAFEAPAAGRREGFEWFGQVASAVVTEAPGTRAWQAETARFAGGVDEHAVAGPAVRSGHVPLDARRAERRDALGHQ